MPINSVNREFNLIVKQTCEEQDADIDFLRPEAQQKILKECFRRWLLKSYIESVRSRLSPIFAISKDSDIICIALSHKVRLTNEDIAKLDLNERITLLGQELSEHDFTFDEENAMRSHEYGDQIPEEWIHRHSSR